MLTDEEFYRISTFMKSKYGIDVRQKREIVNGRLDNFLRGKDCKNFSEYYFGMLQDESGQMEKELINLLTTNHTYFMREFEHFEFLRQEVLPWLREKERHNKDICVWCGAASTGEEPYTLAMVLMEFFALSRNSWDTKVLATDVSTEVLQHAINGIYKGEQVAELPNTWKRRYFRSVDGGETYQVSQELKNEVIFRQFNLMEPFPFKRKMHIVFLRNVMIYFDRDTKERLIEKIYEVMEPGGYLFVGRTETIEWQKTSFRMIQPSIFRK